MKRITVLLVFFVFLGVQVFAQSTVTGTVTDAGDGQPIPGVTVSVKGFSNAGTLTDFDGKYSIKVPEGGTTLVYSFVGMKTQSVTIGGQTVINLQMQSGDIQLGDVVVTALGVSKEKKALGYAISEVSADQIAQRGESDITRVLSGKAAGVNITSTGGVSGTGTNITIRGFSSITGGNQPLFIVDGVRFTSSTNDGASSTQGFLDGNQAVSSRFLDIDPDNIESVSVLKGLSATTIYGNEGRNGVIILTTKTGSTKIANKGFEVSVSQSNFITEVNLPEYQTKYSNGFQQQFGFFFSNWGAEMDNDNPEMVAHPLSRLSNTDLKAEFPEYQDALYPVKFYDNQDQFFQKGHISSTSISFDGANETGAFNANFSYDDDNGYVPNNSVVRFTAGLGGVAKLTNRITVNGSMNFASTDMTTPPISSGGGSGTNGDGFSIFADILYTPVSVDLMGLPYESPITHQSVYYRSGNDIQNPRWTAKYAKATDKVNRVYGNTGVNFDIAEGMAIKYQLGLDFFAETQEYQVNKGAVQNDDYVNGLYRTRNISSTSWDQKVLFTMQKKITSDLGVDFLLGGQSVREVYAADGIESTQQLVFGFMNHKNFTEHASTSGFTGYSLQSKAEVNTLGAFVQTTFDFKDYVYLNLAARNDWYSSLEPDNRSIFYPSASLSFIPTQMFEQIQSTNGLNFLKFRMGYGTSAGFPPLYVTGSYLAAGARSFVAADGTVIATNSVSNQLGNPGLRPELHKELEFGMEVKALNNRVGMEVTLYNKTTDDLITDASLDPATGYTGTYVNIGEIENQGIEIEADFTPIKTNGLTWVIRGIFTKYSTTVIDLAAGQESVLIAGYTDLGNFAIPGEAYGIMMGYAAEKNDAGEYMVGSDGLYYDANDVSIIGDPTPDFVTSVFNTVTYKGFSFNAQFDYRKGGDIYSTTTRALLARGISKDTEFDRLETFVLPGVKEDGTPNDVQISATNAYFDVFGFGSSEFGIYDGTTVRLKEVSLSYVFPKTWLNKTPFGSASITFAGYNLWYKAVNFPEYINFDTDMSSFGVGNGMGFDFITGPSTKRYGASIKLTF